MGDEPTGASNGETTAWCSRCAAWKSFVIKCGIRYLACGHDNTGNGQP